MSRARWSPGKDKQRKAFVDEMTRTGARFIVKVPPSRRRQRQRFKGSGLRARGVLRNRGLLMTYADNYIGVHGHR